MRPDVPERDELTADTSIECHGCSAEGADDPGRRTSQFSPASFPMLEADFRAGQAALDARQQGVHFLGAGGEDGPELVPVDRFGDFVAGVADEPGDLLDGDVAVGHEADEGVPELAWCLAGPDPGSAPAIIEAGPGLADPAGSRSRHHQPVTFGHCAHAVHLPIYGAPPCPAKVERLESVFQRARSR